MSLRLDTGLEELVDSTVNVPTIPATLLELQRVCADENSDSAAVAAVIERDPAVAAKVLRIANSAIYGLKQPVSAIPIASTILGRRVIRNIAIQATVIGQFGGTSGGGDNGILDSLWNHSFRAAVAARGLVAASKLKTALTRDDAYTCGLMHDVGKVLLQQSRGDDFAAALAMSAERDVPLAAAEREVFGFTHADVGGLLARNWNLPDALAAAIQFHHSPGMESAEQTLGTFVHVASSIAHEVADEQAHWRPDWADERLLTALRVPADALDEIRLAVADALVA